MGSTLTPLLALLAFFNPTITRQKLQYFLDGILQNHRGLKKMSWIFFVPAVKYVTRPSTLGHLETL